MTNQETFLNFFRNNNTETAPFDNATVTPKASTVSTPQGISGFFDVPTYNTSSYRKCSDAQIKYYNDLCAQKNQAVDATHSTWSYDQMSAKIGELRAIQVPMLLTQKQANTINDILQRTPSIDINTIAPYWQKYNIAQASELIGKLFDMERTQRHLKPISEAQAQKILRMYLCPDVQFDEIGWVDEYVTYEGRRMLKLPNSEVMYNWLLQNVNAEKGSAFITKFNVPYLNWSRSRISPEQTSMIRTLEARCANLSSAGASHEVSTDSEGNVLANDSASRKEWCPLGYNALSELEIYMLSKTDASKYIEELQRTLADKELIKFPSEPMYGDFVEEKRVLDGKSALNKDAQNMSNFIHMIYSQLGEDLTQEADQVAQTPTKSMTRDDISFIRELIGHAITRGISLKMLTEALDDVPSVRDDLNKDDEK